MKGFNLDAIHEETGTEYDPRGFNWRGLHKDTGEKWDLQNLNREGKPSGSAKKVIFN